MRSAIGTDDSMVRGVKGACNVKAFRHANTSDEDCTLVHGGRRMRGSYGSVLSMGVPIPILLLGYFVCRSIVWTCREYVGGIVAEEEPWVTDIAEKEYESRKW